MNAASQTVWLAIFLPRLATDRLIRSGRAPEGRALAVYAKQANAFLLTGVDARAAALGLRVGMSLADARAIHPDLATMEAEPQEDARTLDDVAAWCERFTPVVAVDAPAGLFLDIAGCAHLFDGEAALRDQIVARLKAQGFVARAAIAQTPGAAWALARYGSVTSPPPGGGRGRGGGESEIKTGGGESEIKTGGGESEIKTQKPENRSASKLGSTSDIPRSPHPLTPSPRGGGGIEIESALTSLPVEALRLDEDAAALLRRLGLKTVGHLLAAPRSSFTARAGQRAMLRLDQALGRAPEALSPRRPAPPVFALRRFLEPLFSVETILQATGALCADVVEKLELRGAGARRASLHLFGVDGRDRVIDIGVSRPEREIKPLLRLFREKLNIAAENLNAEFGIEAARLDIDALERIDGVNAQLVAENNAQASAEQIVAIVDMLHARLGAARVLRGKLNDAHAPEKAGAWRGALNNSFPPPFTGKVSSAEREAEGAGVASPLRSRAATTSPVNGGGSSDVARRPLTLFSRPQPIEALATVPDGPPIRFRWRRVLREVARAEGPERISGDWMRAERLRDYYRVEDKQGRRYWLYREGVYGEAEAPRWFVHGLFA